MATGLEIEKPSQKTRDRRNPSSPERLQDMKQSVYSSKHNYTKKNG